MKKTIIIFSSFFLSALCVNELHAQRFYFGLGAGYGMSLASQTMTYNETGSLNSHSYETVKGSYGKGMSFGIYAGDMFNENIGAELGVSYLLGGKTKRHYLKESSSTEDLVLSAKMIRFNPSLKMTIGDGKIKPYMKFGMVIGVGGKITMKDTWADIGCNCGNTETTWEYTGGISLGASASFGGNYAINEKMSLFGELNFIGQSWAPKKGVLTESTFNGTDVLPNMTTDQKEIDFVKSFTETGTPNSSAPTQRILEYNSFSSIGLNVGLIYSFGGSN